MATIARLYLFDIDTAYHTHISRSSADVLDTVDFTNDLVHWARILNFDHLQDLNLAPWVSNFDEEDISVTIMHLVKVLQDSMDLNVYIDFTNCMPMFPQIEVHRPSDKLSNEKEKAKAKAVIELFVQDRKTETAQNCIKSMDVAMQQHMYLRKLHETMIELVRKLGNADPFDRNIYVGDRSSKVKATLTYFSIMLDFWTHETSGICGFLIDIRKLLSEEIARVTEETATVANDAPAETDPFGKCKKALLKLVCEVVVFVARV